jgi:hypothetical protein
MVRYQTDRLDVGGEQIAALMREQGDPGGTWDPPSSVGDGVQSVLFRDGDPTGSLDETDGKWIDLNYNGSYEPAQDLTITEGSGNGEISDGESGVPMMFRYYYDGNWYGGWDSTQSGGFTGSQSEQFRRMPEVVEVTLYVIDNDGVLVDENDPIIIRRLISLPGGE